MEWTGHTPDIAKATRLTTTDLVSLQGAPGLPPVPDNRCLNDSSQPALLLEPIGDQRDEPNISENMLTAS